MTFDLNYSGNTLIDRYVIFTTSMYGNKSMTNMIKMIIVNGSNND